MSDEPTSDGERYGPTTTEDAPQLVCEPAGNASRDQEGAVDYYPTPPASFVDLGLTTGQLGDMILRLLYLHGTMTGFDIAGQLRLSYGLVDDTLKHLCDERLLEVVSGESLGRVSYRFRMCDQGRSRAREAFDQCRYVGPAPVRLSDYVAYCKSLVSNGPVIDNAALESVFDDLVVADELLDELGPAVCGGRSLFLHGPPGNGKSAIAKRLGEVLHQCGGDVFVPYAIHADGAIITLFDPTIHRPTDTAELASANVPDRDSHPDGSIAQPTLWDLRWRRVRRPVVITGGELTLESLELRYNEGSNYYQAPSHIKANGGVFVIDDLGRQIVRPGDLLNRWAVPLEEQVDYLTLATGKKLAVPFEQLTVFSTNLQPSELVDDAFLRRIRHKVEIVPPTAEQFETIFRQRCRQLGIEFSSDGLASLLSQYQALGRSPRASDARDLLEICGSIAKYRRSTATMDSETVVAAAKSFFGASAESRAA